jgi:hypothetical protein
MAVDPGKEYTVEELYDNYEFKVVKRAIMREFPWITNVTVTQDNLDRYNTIFLDFEVDLPRLLETYGWEPYRSAKRAWKENKYFHSMHLSLLGDVSYEDAKPVANDIEKLYKSISQSPALPTDLRLKTGRRFSIGDFYFHPGRPEW